jgi:neutral ceramidase
MDNLKIGFSKQSINPPLGTFLAGYEYERYSEGVHDDLFSRVIVIEGHEIYIIVELDLVAVDESFINLLWERIYDRWGIGKENLMVCCTHTHSGPGGTFSSDSPIGKGLKSVFGEFDSMLVDYIVRQVVGCVSECLDNMDYFMLRYQSKPLSGIGLNRRNPTIEIDDELQILVFKRNDGRKALIYNHPCHPTVLDKYNVKVSADFPGEAAYLLENIGCFDTALFLNGACGDVSTRFTRHSSSFEEVKRLGSILGDEVLNLTKQKDKDIQASGIRVGNRTISLKTRDFTSAEDTVAALQIAEKKLENVTEEQLDGGQLRLRQSELEGVKNNLHLARGFYGIESIEIVIKVMKISDIIFAFIPGELFASLGLKIKRSIQDSKIFVVCYSGGYIGYIPDSDAYKSGGYESLSSPLAEGEGEKLAQSIIEVIREI